MNASVALQEQTARLEELQERLETIAFKKRSIASKQWNMDDELEKVTKRVGRDNGNLQFFRAESARFAATAVSDEAIERRLEAELAELALLPERAIDGNGEISPESAVNQLSARLSTARAAVDAHLRSRNAGLGICGGADGDSDASRRARELRAAISADEHSFAAFSEERTQELQMLRSELAMERSSWPQQQAPAQQRRYSPLSPLATPDASNAGAGASPSRQLTTAQMRLTQLQSELMGLDKVSTRRTHAGRHRLQQVEEQIIATKRTIAQLKIVCA